MKITIFDAENLLDLLEERINLFSLSSISKNTDESRQQWITLDAERQILKMCFYNIKTLVNTANVHAGVDLNQQKIAMACDRVKELELILDQEQNIHSFLTEEDVTQAKNEIINLKQQSLNLKKDILIKKMDFQIDISDQTQEHLMKIGLIHE